MFFSKSAITLLSTITASSVPLVSIIVLYQIKDYSLRNRFSSSQGASNDFDNVIATSQPEIKVEEKEEEKEKTEEKQDQEKVEVKKEEPKPEPKAISEDVTTVKATKTSTKPNKESTTTATIPEIKKIEDIGAVLQQLLDDFIEQANKPVDQKIDTFIELLNKKQSHISDDGEKKELNSVITALTSLKSKI